MLCKAIAHGSGEVEDVLWSCADRRALVFRTPGIEGKPHSLAIAYKFLDYDFDKLGSRQAFIEMRAFVAFLAMLAGGSFRIREIVIEQGGDVVGQLLHGIHPPDQGERSNSLLNWLGLLAGAEPALQSKIVRSSLAFVRAHECHQDDPELSCTLSLSSIESVASDVLEHRKGGYRAIVDFVHRYAGDDIYKTIEKGDGEVDAKSLCGKLLKSAYRDIRSPFVHVGKMGIPAMELALQTRRHFVKDGDSCTGYTPSPLWIATAARMAILSYLSDQSTCRNDMFSPFVEFAKKHSVLKLRALRPIKAGEVVDLTDNSSVDIG